jgi:hypothetical protein
VQSLQPLVAQHAVASMSVNAAAPNPSLERTSTGWPLPAVVHVASSGQPAPAAQLKR